MTEACSVGGKSWCYCLVIGDHMGHEILVPHEHFYKSIAASLELPNDGA